VFSDIVYATSEELAEAGPIESEYMKLDVFIKKENAVDLPEQGQPSVVVGDSSNSNNQSRKRLMPVIVYIHGGAWTKGAGHKGNNVPMPYMLAEQGWVGVSINYRLFPDNVFPTYIIDCKRALRWVKENIESYGGDPNFIVVSGGSAGGHLAALLALSGPRSNVEVSDVLRVGSGS
jgi:acetyl esterase/lipase